MISRGESGVLGKGAPRNAMSPSGGAPQLRREIPDTRATCRPQSPLSRNT